MLNGSFPLRETSGFYPLKSRASPGRTEIRTKGYFLSVKDNGAWKGRGGTGKWSAFQSVIDLLCQWFYPLMQFQYRLFLLSAFFLEFEQFARDIQGGQDGDFHVITIRWTLMNIGHFRINIPRYLFGCCRVGITLYRVFGSEDRDTHALNWWAHTSPNRLPSANGLLHRFQPHQDTLYSFGNRFELALPACRIGF